MRTPVSSFRAKQIMICISAAFSLAGYSQIGFAVNNLPVGNCLDDGGPTTLRSVAGGASTGDTVDMSSLICSIITLKAGSCAINLPHGVILQGPGIDKLTIEGNQCRIFNSTSTDRLTINDLTLTDGLAYNATGSVAGGCVVASGDVFVNRSLVTNCTAAALATGARAYGGGISTAGTANLLNTSVTHNQVSGGYVAYGGGINAQSLVLTYSSLSGNSATVTPVNSEFARGAGAFVGTGILSLNSSTVDSNTAYIGGGLSHYVNSSSVTEITNSTISGNYARNTGAFFQYCFGCGSVPSPNISIYNSTVAFNSSGIKTTSSIFAHSSIFSNNYGFDVYIVDNTSTLTGANNLIIATNVTPEPGVITVTGDPRLTPLAYHGVTTNLLYPRTLGLSVSSPALGLGDNVNGLLWDERGDQNGGFPRTRSGGAVDIGAFERQPNDDELFYGGFN